MILSDLAKKCGATIEEVVRTIEVQFHVSLSLIPGLHVPDKFVSRILYMYHRGQLVLGEIITINNGGYLLKSVGAENYELFCPFSKSPTRIDRAICDKMIGLKWLVRIESNPRGEGNNTVVSAKLEQTDYDGILQIDECYSAIVCSYNEKGANVLVERYVPMFVPNRFVGWKKDNNAQTDLKLGDIVTVKILKNDKGIIASIRDASMDPWSRVSSVYPIGTVVETVAIQIEERYIRVNLGEYTGNLSADEISWMETPDCKNISLPDPLCVVVTGYHDMRKTVEVSLKRLMPDPWEDPDKYLPEDRIVTAEITYLTNGGAWLKVGELGFKGYLSYRDIDWCRNVDKNNFPYVVGDYIKVKVIHLNKEHRKITCSLKTLVPNPWEELSGKESVEGDVLKVNPGEGANVRLEGGIECVCHEAFDPESEGQILTFDILKLNVAAQQIIISHKKQEIVNLNTLAVGEMFKEYRDLTVEDKKLYFETGDEEESEVYRVFTVKEVSSTGRVTARYAEDDKEYENGILLPGAVTINGSPVNIIFARQIIKKHIRPGNRFTFRVTHRYEGFNYAVLAIDAADLLDLNNIATDDIATLNSIEGVEATVLRDICTKRNIFVQWKGYFGYIPRAELLDGSEELPAILRLKAVTGPEHSEQMIRFTLIDEKEVEEEREEQQEAEDIAVNLERDMYDCYREINDLSGFNPNLPDYYPYALQLRFDPKRDEELAQLISSEPTYFSSQTFFLDCKSKDGNWFLTVFNNKISISAFCREREDGDEIRIQKYNLDVTDSPNGGKYYGKPLRIAGENIQIVPLNSPALPPARQDADIVMALLKYNREVLPELSKLRRDGFEKRGEHYLTLKELLNMDLDREVSLCRKEVTIYAKVTEDAGCYGGYGVVFDADEDAFDAITSKDDSDEGIKVIIKPANSESFKERYPSGVLKYLGSRRWIVELYSNQEPDIDSINQSGLQVKRFPNIRHLEKQIRAIDNFVYERNGLDIFSKIARKKLKPVVTPSVESIEANKYFNLQDPADSQANALKMALGGSQITLIQGPPGTGKSTVIVDIIRNLVKQHKKVLVCTQSVAPVEELYSKLSGRKKGKPTGNPVKVDGQGLRCAYLRDDESIEISGSVAERRNALKDMMLLVKSLKNVNSSANETTITGLKKSKERLETHHKEDGNEVVRKFTKDILPQCDDVVNILNEYHGALDKEDVENFASEHRTLNMEAVDVVFGTCIGVGVNPILKDLHFDTLIIDEAGKANYAETLVPMMMADEYILVGDDKQLPPYTNSELVKEMARARLNKDLESDDEGLSEAIEAETKVIMEDIGKSLFGDLKPRLPESNQIMLSKQFRMHPEIGNFVSKLFYDGKVDSVPKPCERTLNIPGLGRAITFIDTSGMGSEARESRQGMSLYNDGEIQVIEEKLLPMLESALDTGRTVGILSPYGAQVMRMRQHFPKLKNHIFTIDSIQGEEYDIVVLSFVRNTRSGSLNFVDDLRRLNVLFSRAKCNLIMVGHLDTLQNKSLHNIDKDAVMAVYNEIKNKKVELVVHHGAMQQLYDDFPPESSHLVKNLDNPYHVFEDCRPTKNGQFTSFYNRKLLTLYNPVLKEFSKDAQPKSFRANLIGYINEKPHTMIEPVGFWLSKQSTLKDFEFSAVVNTSEQSNLTLEMADKSLILLSIPNSQRFVQGMRVKVEVWNNKKFTVKPIDNE